MTTIKCSGEGCTAVFETSEPVSLKAAYSCKLHTRSTGEKLSFQKAQFDKDLDGGPVPVPVGTTHIQHQGPRVATSEDMFQDTMRERAVFLSEKDAK